MRVAWLVVVAVAARPLPALTTHASADHASRTSNLDREGM